MDILPPVIAELRASISDFQAKMAEAQGEMDEVSGKADETNDKLATMGKGVFLGLAAVGAAVGAFSIDMAMKNQEATATLSANADITVAKAQQISSAFLDTAGKSIFSGTAMTQAYSSVAAELATVQGHALSTGQAILVMKSATDLAEASGQSLTTATTALGNVMQAYQVKASGAAAVGTVLFNVARETGTSLSQVSTAVTKLHSTLGVLTPPLNQVGGLLIDMTEHGETGRKALSALNTAMTTLLKSATGTAQAQANLKVAIDQLPPSLRSLANEYQAGTISSESLETATESMSTTQAQAWGTFTDAADAIHKASVATSELGITVTNSKGQFVGMASVIAQLQPKLQGMTQAQQLATLATVFGSSANKTLLTTILAGPKAFDAATAAAERHRSEQQALAAQMSTLKHEFEVVEATVEDYGVKIGDYLLPKIQDLIHFLGESAAWLDKNRIVLYLLGAVAIPLVVAALGAFAVNTISGFVKNIGQAIDSVETFAGKILGIRTASGEAAADVATNTAAMNADLNETSETATTTATDLDTVTSTAGAAGAVGAAGASGSTVANNSTTTEAATQTDAAAVKLDTAADALQAAGSSLDEAAAALKEAAGAAATVTEDQAVDSQNADGAVAGGGAAEGEAGAAEAGSEEEVVGEAVAGSFIKGAIGKGIGGLIAVQLYNAFIEKPLGKKIGTDAASTLGDAATGAAIGVAILPFAAPIGAGIGAAAGTAFAQRGPIEGFFNQAAQPHPKGSAGVLRNAENWTGDINNDINHAFGGLFHALAPSSPTAAPGSQSKLDTDRAKDSTLQKQMAVLSQLKATATQQATEYGKNSAEAKAADNALITTEQKWFPKLGGLDKLTSVDTNISSLKDKIDVLQAAAHADSVYGTAHIDAAKAAVDEAKSVLAKAEDVHASTAAIQQDKQSVDNANQKLQSLQTAAADQKSIQASIKTDTAKLSQLEDLKEAMQKINTDTTALKGQLNTGIKVTQLPHTSIKASGGIKLVIG
jgi:hypothetical protein